MLNMKLIIKIICFCLLSGPFCISSSIRHYKNKIKINSYGKVSENLKENNATVYNRKEEFREITSNSNNDISQPRINLKLKNSLIFKNANQSHFISFQIINDSKIENFNNNPQIKNDKKNTSKYKKKEKKQKRKFDNYNKSYFASINLNNNSLFAKRKSNSSSNIEDLNQKTLNDVIIIENQNKTAKKETYYYDPEEDDTDNADNLSRYHNFIFKSKCNSNRCAAPKGQCLIDEKDRICRCSPSYLNYKYSNGEVIVCGYSQKSQFIAFVMELTLMFAGNIYLGFYFYAYIKAIVYLTIFLFAFFKLPCKLCGLENMIKSKCYLCPWIEYTTIIIVIFGIFCWQTVDLMNIITPNNKDAYNMPILDYF